MPELPEVETVVRELRPLLLGRRLKTIAVSRYPLRKPWQREWVSLLRGRRVAQVWRRGKWIILDLEHNMHLVIHLGMTGQLTVAPRRQPSAAHTHLVFSLDRGRHELRFRDVRRFGSATVFPDGEHLDSFFADTRLGPEPFDLRPRYWRQQLAKTSRCLKAVLLDQCVVAGVGNIYADEALFQARLQPAQRGWDTTAAQAARLRRAIVQVLNRAIDCRGSTIRDYIGGSGKRGEFQNEFRVYGRTGEPCLRCGTPIRCIRLAGRSTHFCPHCQRPASELLG